MMGEITIKYFNVSTLRITRRICIRRADIIADMCKMLKHWHLPVGWRSC